MLLLLVPVVAPDPPSWVPFFLQAVASRRELSFPEQALPPEKDSQGHEPRKVTPPSA